VVQIICHSLAQSQRVNDLLRAYGDGRQRKDGAVLHIEAPHFKPYEIAVYVPSDFAGNLAIMLKRDKAPGS